MPVGLSFKPPVCVWSSFLCLTVSLSICLLMSVHLYMCVIVDLFGSNRLQQLEITHNWLTTCSFWRPRGNSSLPSWGAANKNKTLKAVCTITFLSHFDSWFSLFIINLRMEISAIISSWFYLSVSAAKTVTTLFDLIWVAWEVWVSVGGALFLFYLQTCWLLLLIRSISRNIVSAANIR